MCSTFSGLKFRQENIESVIRRIEERCDKMKEAILQLLKQVDHHKDKMLEEARSCLTEKTGQKEESLQKELLPGEMQPSTLHYDMCYLSNVLPQFMSGCLKSGDGLPGIPESLYVKPQHLQGLSLGSMSLSAIETTTCSNSSEDSNPEQDFPANLDPSINTPGEVGVTHKLFKLPKNTLATVRDFVFALPSLAFIASRKRGLFMLEGDNSLSKINGDPSSRLCLAGNWLFVSKGYRSSPCDTVKRYQILNEEPSQGPKEAVGITVKGGQKLHGMAYNSTQRLLAICDHDQLTIHDVENGQQVDTLKGQELFEDYSPIDAAWLDDSRLCVLLNSSPISVKCISITYKEVVWSAQLPTSNFGFISSVYGKVYVRGAKSKMLTVLDGAKGKTVQQIQSPRGWPFRVIGRDSTVIVGSFVFEQNISG